MGQAIRWLADVQRELAAGSVGVGFTGVGDPLSHPARQIFIQNLTDGTLQFSFNGTDKNFPLPPNGYFLSDITSNKTSTQGLFLGTGDRLYVQQIDVPTTGSVYFTVFYASDD